MSRLSDASFAYARIPGEGKLPQADIIALDEIHDAYFEKTGLYEETNPTELEYALAAAYRLGVMRGMDG